MDASFTEDYGTGAMSSHAEGMSVGQRCQSVDSLAEWRSSEQLENGTPSTSPSFWDTDDDDCGPRPSELYGKFTWKIENYSQINKRELRSNPFEVGGYKWYILIYPQGCDVCNHLSLFLCVANHDKLLPGWSHFAQFTISVVNKDPNFSKFSDTLHRFWKKEHDWGWKKFMELTKVEDGFVNNETLLIKAQVQVIREKAHRPFRCLDYQYRRELLRVYLSNVEQICRRFFEDRKNKLNKLIDDKVRWSSFCSFWLGIDQNSRRCISRDKLDTILRVIVKHFFVEKEVTSTLVMDSLYSGLKALEYQSENKKERKRIEMEESAVPMVRVDKDMFVLADDVISLLDRVASEPLPVMSLPPKDGKVSQNRTKEGSSSDDFNDSIERDERRLTELGRRTVEIFVLAHIFSSRIEVAYQEAVALKRQEELIREEEEAGQAEHELKAKRAAGDKEKRAKKKQGKQKRNNRKNKEKQRDFKSDLVFNDKTQEEKYLDEIASRELSLEHLSVMNERMDTPEDASDISYNGGDVAVPLYPDLEDRDSNPKNWETDALELHPSIEASASEMSSSLPEKANLGLDDSSSNCSTDSVPSIVSNGTCRRNSVIINSIQTSPDRAKPYGGKCSQNHQSVASHPGEILDSSPSTCHELEGDDVSRKSSIQRHYSHLVEKQELTPIPLKNTSKDQGDAEKLSNIRTLESSSASPEPGRKTQPLLQRAKPSLQNGTTGTNSITSSIGLPASSKELPSSNLNAPKRSAALSTKSSHSSATKFYPTPAAKNITSQPTTPISRPSSAPLIPVAPRPNTTAISTVQVAPLLSRSTSATTRQAADPSPSAPSYVPQSYRNAIMGKNVTGLNLAGFAHSPSAPLIQSSTSSSQSTISSISASLFPTPSMTRKEQQKASKPGLTFGSVKPESLHIHQQSILTKSAEPCNSNLLREPVSTSHGGVADEFPHLDIINDLLDEEQSLSNQYYYHPLHHRHHSFNGRYSFPGDAASVDLSSGRFDQTKQYYDDNFLSIYSSSSGRAHEAQVDLSMAYANCQMDGLIQSTWPYSPADLSLINLGSTDGGGDGYSYHNLSDYPNLGGGLNGYSLYRP
ncbi:TNF receptor-associated factor homolog 1a-like isoform X2 [Dendrobium catenatum]|uniref:TNF receptor-associated factor homolog 1a-like isoform X2 n=1 Tax=Dendrobium catenatum TaxID=906689 RepID=UPI00109F7FD1|nr:TNF receptor-associated factor homolog 1a-like isoform X2 [Dendrobium catenatum]